MILQALYDLAQKESLMEDPDFESKPVAWLVRVSEEGKLLSIDGTHYLPEKRGRGAPKPIPKTFPLPRERPVTSGDRAFLLFNKAEYELGKDPDQKREPEKLERHGSRRGSGGLRVDLVATKRGEFDLVKNVNPGYLPPDRWFPENGFQ